MNIRKIFGYGLLAVMFALAALSLTGCGDVSVELPPGPDTQNPNPQGEPANTPATITYTAVQTGGVSSTTTSAGIVFTFSASIDDLSLTAENITVGGTAAKGSATLTGSGTSWTLSTITVNNAGLATVKITKTGIEAATKDVIVHKAGEATPEYWTITWHLNGGAGGAGAYPTQIVKGAVLAQPSPDPTKAGNTFVNWYTDSGLTTAYDFSATVTANLNLYAKWIPAGPDITYTLAQYGGENGIKDSEWIQFNFSASVDDLGLTAADITVTGAASAFGELFENWLPITVNYAGQATVQINKPGIEAGQKSVTVFIAGEESFSEYFSITWDLAGGEKGTGAYPDRIGYGQKIAKPTPDPTRAGYILDNWLWRVVGNSSYNTYNFGEQKIYGNVELQAQWNEIMNKPIIWNLDGGEKGAGAYPETITKGTVLAKPSPDPTKDDSLFGGWYTDSDLTTAYNFSNAVNVIESLTLYAKWIAGTPGLAYTAIGTTAYSVSKGTVMSGEVVIPATHAGLPVTTIADAAFYDVLAITGVTIPASITSIGYQAFTRTSLASVTIPASVTSIGYGAFVGCSSLVSVTFAGSIPSASFSSDTTFPVFDGDLRDKFYPTPLATAGIPGTYTATVSGDSKVWTRQQ